MTEAVGSENIETFRDKIACYIAQDNEFYQRVCRVYEILDAVRANADEHGHGISFLLARSNEKSSALEDALEDAVPYNGRPHSIYDDDIVDVVGAKRELDGASYVEPNGQITYAGIELMIGTSEFKRKYGIPKKLNIRDFLGLDSDDGQLRNLPAGMRNRSAINGTDKLGESALLITLGENDEVNVYYCGDRVYNSKGRKVRWDLAERLPPTRADNSYVVPQAPIPGPNIPYGGDGLYEQTTA